MEIIFELFCILLAGLIIISLILPWVNHSDLNSLKQEIQQLRNQLANALKLIQEKEITTEKKSETIVTPQTSAITSEPTSITETIPSGLLPEKVISEKSTDIPLSQTKTQQEIPIKTKSKIDFEQQFGARLPVWVGAIALALAGFFLVKYSIEAGFLTEKVRVTIGLIFGISLILAANLIRNKTELTNGKSIAQALSGAGIADLYLCVFAATNLYHIFPSLIGFLAMAAITAVAVILSLRHGMPIALLGLIGGLLTPALIHSQSPNAFLLFLYLYIVLLGLFVIIRKQQWWSLAFPAVIGAMIWVIFWLFFCYVPGDSIWLGLFLVAVSATYILTSKQQFATNIKEDDKKFKLSSILNYLTLGSAALLMGLVGFKGGFGIQEWSLFGLLAAGGIVMAYFNQKLYGFVPWLLMIVNAVMLLSWNNPALNTFVITAIIFALLYTSSGYFSMWRAPNPVNWAGLVGAASVLYFLIAYYQLHKISIFTISFTHSWVWGSISLLLSVFSVFIIWQILDKFNFDNRIRQQVLAIFVLSTIAFLSLGLMIILKENMLAIAFATEVLAISWINTKVDIKALRPCAGLLSVVFVLLLIPQLFSFVELSFSSLISQEIYIQSVPIIASSPLFQLGVPAMMFAYASWLFREQQDNKLINYFEFISLVLVSVMGYCLIRNVFHTGNNWFAIISSFTERGIITNMFCFIGLICLLLDRQYRRPFLSLCGLVLFGIAAFRIIYFDFALYNPLWAHQYVGNIPILNALFIPYGITIAWFSLANQQLNYLKIEKPIKYSNIFCLILLFALITLSVRQLYQGGYLDSDNASNAEIYTYSIVWLLLGIGLLVSGTLKHDKTFRVASLLVMIFTVGKVFLYDASVLSGFYRVFSFLVLGMILIGLSWFYTRFVFIDK